LLQFCGYPALPDEDCFVEIFFGAQRRLNTKHTEAAPSAQRKSNLSPRGKKRDDGVFVVRNAGYDDAPPAFSKA